MPQLLAFIGRIDIIVGVVQVVGIICELIPQTSRGAVIKSEILSGLIVVHDGFAFQFFYVSDFFKSLPVFVDLVKSTGIFLYLGLTGLYG